ncbi:MAG TPA: transporter substrate-binding domain-containing protein, partial [Sphingobium sp.]
MEAGVGQVTTYDSLTDVLRDMAFGRIDAGFGDGPLIAYQLMVGPKRPARFVEEFRPPVREQLCLLVQKHSPLLPAINRAITQLGRNRIAAVTRHWGIE